MKRFALVATVVVALVSGLQAQDAARLLRAAMNTEMVDGDLEGAIAHYKKIAASGDRPVAAQALLRMAEVYTKLGQPAARETYQTIVRDYADQPVATVARTRLSAGAASRSQEVTPRRVLEGGWAKMFDLSADGRFTVGPERSGYSAFNIVLRDLVSGRVTTLVEGTSKGSGFQARISNDGRRVAYNYWDEKEVFSLRVIGTEAGATPETIDTGLSNSIPLDWAPDGKTVLVGLRRLGDPARPQQMTSTELAWVSVETKALRTIKTFESWQTPRIPDVRVSPDGQFVAYSAQPQPGSTDRYLYVIDATGQRESAIVTAAGQHGSPVWTPDGGHLLFVSTTAGRSSLSAIALQNAQPTGAPWVVWRDLAGDPLGFTTSGTFYYEQSVGGGNYEYIVNRNPSPGERPVTFLGLSASWSRSGSVAFVRHNGNELDLIIRDVETGQERTYQHPGIGVQSPSGLPDGSGVIVLVNPGGQEEKRATFYLADVQTGNFRRLFDRDANGRERSSVGAVAPDGKTLYLSVRSASVGPVTGIVGVDLATGEERPAFSYPSGSGPSDYPGLAVSPDGSTLAVSSWVKPNAVARIFTVGVDGSNYREVVESYQAGWVLDVVRWTPDGRTILFVAHDANRNWKVMRVPAVGGLVEFDGLSFETLAPLIPELRMWPGNFNNIDVSPDGTRIIASSLTFTKNELWTLDNLLSVVSSR